MSHFKHIVPVIKTNERIDAGAASAIKNKYRDWCFDNCQGMFLWSWADQWPGYRQWWFMFSFELETDAVMFKLVVDSIT